LTGTDPVSECEAGVPAKPTPIPNDSAAAIALLEHRWAIPLRGAILEAGGTVFADSWVHPSDLVAAGLADAAESG
jgi:hypothetical protein